MGATAEGSITEHHTEETGPYQTRVIQFGYHTKSEVNQGVKLSEAEPGVKAVSEDA